MSYFVALNYCVYVLISEVDNQFYIGYTKDIHRRFREHSEGFVDSTKYRRPLKLIFLEYYIFKEDAMNREKYFKTTKGRRMLKIILFQSLMKLGYKNLKKEDID